MSLAGRPPDPREQDLLARLIVSQTGFFEGQPKATQAFLEIGETPAEPALDPVQLAATTVMCQTILNLDAVIWNR